jgi:hypothetical protein
MGEVDIINSTLGKALGGAAGGYTSGPKELIDLLRQKSRPYLFSNSLPPPVVGGAMKVKFCNVHYFHELLILLPLYAGPRNDYVIEQFNCTRSK